MKNILMILRFEYLRQIRRRSFLFTVLGVPLLIGMVFGIIVLVSMNVHAEQKIGIVDLSGDSTGINVSMLDLDTVIPVTYFDTEAAAQAAFEARGVDAYAVIPADYITTGRIAVTTREHLSDAGRNEIEAIAHAGVLARVPPDARARLAEPMHLTLRSPESGREIEADNFLMFLLPYLFALLFTLTTFMTSGYLLQAVTEEKEERIVEILATTVAPHELMAGKILGLSAVGLTQMGIWIGLVVIVVLSLSPDLSWLAQVHLPLSLLLLALLYFVLGYLLICSCYAAIGASVTTPQEAQPLVAPISMLALSPLFLVVVILAQPNGMLATILSFIPFSAPVTMLLRLPIADVPSWEIVVNLLVLTIFVYGAMVLAGRVMRLGLLNYGKRLSLREMFGREQRVSRAAAKVDPL